MITALDLFGSKKLNQKGVEKYELIKMNFENCLAELIKHTGGGDERCIAIMKTKMEEACFFAQKAMTRNEINQQKEGK